MKNFKNGKYCFFLLVMFTCISSIKGQESYGDNPEKCKQKLSIMTTYYKQKSYLDAAPSWRYIIKNCPRASKNTYIIGNKIMELNIRNASTEESKALFVDSLLMNQDMRMKHFPKNKPNKQLAKKAIYLLKYRLKQEYKTAFTLLDSAFKTGPDELNAYDFKMYMYCYKLMIKSKVKQCDEMLDTYLLINSILTLREKNGKKVKEKTKRQITEYAEICMGCELLDSLYGTNFEARKTDTLWLDNGILLFKKKQCNSSLTFLLLLETRYVSKPNANTASTLGKYYLNTQDFVKAGTYFDDAIALENDSIKIAVHHVNKAKFFIAAKKYSQAYFDAKKAVAQDPNSMAAYMIIGDAIAYSSGQCNNLTFGGKENYWLAVDYYSQALRLSDDDKVKSSARKKISKFKKFFPEKGDLFLKSLAEGASYKVGCYLNENTKVRSLK
ncbi:MAG: tetratricopeptide (TPR) repeat protein [Glaciecola sp.]|jgi:tetratricopeptide (TPR) repeat protein